MNEILCDRYQILNPLGSGGFGETFLAVDLHSPTQGKVVVKALKSVNHHTYPKQNDKSSSNILIIFLILILALLSSFVGFFLIQNINQTQQKIAEIEQEKERIKSQLSEENLNKERNDVVQYIRGDFPWYYIRVIEGSNRSLNGRTGWVNANYLECA